MKTSKPICGITYNTPRFLRARLDELRAAGRISQAYWVAHEPDTDSKKPHTHLVIFTTSSVDPWAFAEAFVEVDVEAGLPRRFLPNPDTQGRCLSVADWLWYGIHDSDYLASKGMERNVHYSRDAVQALDLDELHERWASLPPVRLGRQALTARALTLAGEGRTWPEIVLELGAELSRDPFLLGYLYQVTVAAHGHAEQARALLDRLKPASPPPKAQKAPRKASKKGSRPLDDWPLPSDLDGLPSDFDFDLPPELP